MQCRLPFCGKDNWGRNEAIDKGLSISEHVGQCNGAVQWGSKSSQTDGIIALQIEQPQRHEEGFDEGIQFVASISGDAMKLLTKDHSFLSMSGSAMGQQKQPDGRHHCSAVDQAATET
jgi:hypothetical protein